MSGIAVLRALDCLCARQADEREKRLSMSIRAAICGEFARGTRKQCHHVGSMFRRKTTAGSSPRRSGADSKEARLRKKTTFSSAPALPSTPPPPPAPAFRREGHANVASLHDQQQENSSQAARNVSFDDVVKEVLIENRQQAYGNKANRRQHFYSKTELAIFKRAWYWHLKASSSQWPVDRLLRCGCPSCDMDEGREDLDPEPKGDYISWKWEN